MTILEKIEKLKAESIKSETIVKRKTKVPNSKETQPGKKEKPKTEKKG